MKKRKIAIIGLGLMGGSLAAACRARFPKAQIIGVTRNRAALQFARRKKWIHQGYTKISPELSDVDFIILCTPVSNFLKSLKLLDRHLRQDAIVTDVGSVKGEIERQVAKIKFRHVHFVGAHPMVGSHLRGIHAASRDLYQAGYTFLMRSKKVKPKVYKEVKSFWQKVSKKVIEVTPKQHDEIVSDISHLPHAAAVCLMLAIDPKQLRFAAKGLSDTTRIAAGDASVWAPIFLSNRGAVLKALKKYEQNLKKFRNLVAKKSPKNLEKALKIAGRRRREISF